MKTSHRALPLLAAFGALALAFTRASEPLAAQQPRLPAAAQRTTAARPAERPATPLTRAKTAFLINERTTPVTSKQFRQLQGELRRWRRFDLVNTANRADVTISLGPTPSLTVRQRTSGAILWTTTGGTVPVMLQRFQKEFPAAPKVCFIVWCR